MSNKTRKDDPPSIVAMLLVGISGAYTTVVMPLLVSAAATEFVLDNARASWVALAEFFGIGIGTIIAGAFVARGNRKLLVVIGALIAIAGSLASALVGSLEMFLVSRILAGLGSGVLLGTSAAVIGATANPDRNFALFPMGAFLLAGLGFRFLPWLIDIFGFAGLFFGLAALSASCLVAALHIPAFAAPVVSDADVSTENSADRVFTLPVFLGLGGIITYYFAVGGVWVLMSRIGESIGVAPNAVTNTLSNAALAGMAAAGIAALLSTRLGRTQPFVVGIAILILSLGWLGISGNAVSFTLAPLIFMFGWNLLFPYMMGMLAAIDVSGRTLAWNMTLQNIGFALGPLITGKLADTNGVLSVTWFAVIGSLATLVLFLFAMSIRKSAGGL